MLLFNSNETNLLSIELDRPTREKNVPAINVLRILPTFSAGNGWIENEQWSVNVDVMRVHVGFDRVACFSNLCW